ncbi:abortive infection family protein [Desulfobacter curvatus]|uniref:abortive infection family protein n=1 Tax=Desulfobacter curvatus TaxID=2290 RepID=UPI000361707E|nr:abortive infection family protein [Desulfobacter curvatus]
MSDLSGIEKMKLEKFLDMEGGYVLEFSNRTFQEFIKDSLEIDIYDARYDYASGSKANRMRAFWKKEPNYPVGKLLSDMLEYWKAKKLTRALEITPSEQALYDECHKISVRLREDSPVEHIDAIQADTNDKDFSLLAKSIHESIQKNEPEVALDRLHTYVVKYTKRLCDRHGIAHNKKIPLHAMFGGYIKHLKNKNMIASAMTERILKTSISILEAFNDVRNNQSFAHDNPILNYDESLLIFNNVSNAIRFINSIDQEPKEEPELYAGWEPDDAIPF